MPKKRIVVPPRPRRDLPPRPPTINELWMMLRMIGARFLTVERHLADIGTNLDNVQRHIDYFASLAYTPEPTIHKKTQRKRLDLATPDHELPKGRR